MTPDQISGQDFRVASTNIGWQHVKSTRSICGRRTDRTGLPVTGRVTVSDVRHRIGVWPSGAQRGNPSWRVIFRVWRFPAEGLSRARPSSESPEKLAEKPPTSSPPRKQGQT